MIHSYSTKSMICDDYHAKAERALNTIESIEPNVSLNPPIATITMKKNIPAVQLQRALAAIGKYILAINDNKILEHNTPKDASSKSCCSMHSHNSKKKNVIPTNTQEKYYCPMHCEGKQVYDKAGNCPVCGMVLVKTPDLTVSKALYTCPMHPEVISEMVPLIIAFLLLIAVSDRLKSVSLCL